MANNQFNLSFVANLDRGITLTPLRQAFMEDDHQAHVFTVKAMRGGAAVPLAGAAVTGYFIPNGMETAVQLPGSVDASGAASVSLTRDCYAFLGRFNLVIQTTIDGVDSSIFYGEGYVTRTRTDKVIEPSGAVPSLGTLEQMIQNLTYADVGAAPAGFGLGVDAYSLSYIENANQSLGNGWYRIDGSTENGISASAVMRVDAYSGSILCQTAYSGAYSSDYPAIQQRWYRGGTWHPWGWVNPPMALGVEYRTTEWYLGRAVYCKMVNFGALPNATKKNVEHGIVDKYCNVRSSLSIVGSGADFNHDSRIKAMSVSSTIIQIETTEDLSAYADLYVTLWYTK